jgi:hypothetical protein
LKAIADFVAEKQLKQRPCLGVAHVQKLDTEPTTSELKQVNGSTYLRVEQKYTSYSARFIFNCARDGKLLLMGGIFQDTVA